MKLSKLQQQLLDRLEQGVWISVSDIQDINVNLNTMWSLKDKGLIEVESKHNEGLGFCMKKL